MTIASWIETALAASGSDDCVVIVRALHQLNLRWAASALTTNGQMSQLTASVVSISGAATGSASGPVTDVDDLTALVARADAAACTAPESADAMPLPDGGVDDDFAAEAESIDVSAFAPLTAQLGEAFAAASQEGHLLYGFAEYMRQTVWLGSSAGTRRRAVEPWGRFEFTAKMPDMVNSAWVGQQTNDFTDVDVAAHHDELRRRLAWGRTRVDLPAGRYETILSPGAVVDLIYPMTWDMSLQDAIDGRSVFSATGTEGGTKIGSSLSPLPFSFTTDPGDARFPTVPFVATASSTAGVTSVFDNGAPVEKIDWIRDGSLTQLYAPRADMAKHSIPGPVASAAENMIFQAQGTASLEEMIASTKRGLLVTCLWYIRTVDPQTLMLTGLTRDGIYLIEDGEVVGLVNNFRWNESPLDLMQRCTEVSKAEHCLCREWNDWFIRSVAPAMRIPDFNMSTVSQAV